MSKAGRLRCGALLLGLFLLAGCGDDNPTSPGRGLEVTNATDNFQYQVTGVRNYTKVVTYMWENTGTAATVNQATTVEGGSVTLVILDADGVQVYSRSLVENGTFETSTGAAGSWAIRLTYSDADATVSFRVQKKS
jgi:hypothetical protein